MKRTDRQYTDADDLIVPVTYCREWQDGFGARGWKLDVGIGDAHVVASTAYSGENIPTSVLIHDIVDHHLCGFRLSGHRDEAMALVQMRGRTGTDITPDYAQMVDEDILQGLVSGEPLESFLPEDLLGRLPAEGTARTRMQVLCRRIGTQALRQRLIEHFFALGETGCGRARAAWETMGLDYDRRGELALALQDLLVQADAWMLQQDTRNAHGHFVMTESECSLRMNNGKTWRTPY